jgi:hypothetical protein
MPSGVNAFEISDIQEEKLTPDQLDDQDVTMLHCPEKPLDSVFAEHTGSKGASTAAPEPPRPAGSSSLICP